MFEGFDKIKKAQNIARDAYLRMLDEIRPGMTEREIRKRFEINLIDLGSFSFWRYGIGATVHVGKDRSRDSRTTRAYRETEIVLGDNDLLVFDIAPSCEFYWGDFSRTVFVEDGKVVKDYNDLKTPEFKDGIATELALHNYLLQVAKPDMTFEHLYRIMDNAIEALGYINLDFGSNVGHSVELDSTKRRVLKAGEVQTLNMCDCFTFEPHIGTPDGRYGFKRENIYYFDENGKLKELI